MKENKVRIGWRGKGGEDGLGHIFGRPFVGLGLGFCFF
jgi:hypothetical protein